MADTTAKAPAGSDRPTAQAFTTTGPQPVPDLVDYLREYARHKPETAALWCLGIGFVLGWKLKPW
jgi:hypothetical protein